MNESDKYILCSLTLIIVVFIGAMAYGEYLSFTTQKEKIKTIQMAIERDIDSDHLKSLFGR